jgi:hypothetical protein
MLRTARLKKRPPRKLLRSHPTKKDQDRPRAPGRKVPPVLPIANRSYSNFDALIEIAALVRPSFRAIAPVGVPLRANSFSRRISSSTHFVRPLESEGLATRASGTITSDRLRSGARGNAADHNRTILSSSDRCGPRPKALHSNPAIAVMDHHHDWLRITQPLR